jgi:CBS domain-containing protein
MRISEIMTSDFEMIDSTSSLTEAAQKMKSLNVGFLPVQEGTRLIGLVTDRDIVVRAVAEGRDPSSAQVKDVITSELIFCYDDDSIEDAARLMEDNQVRRLIVTDHNKTPVGVVSLGDIAEKSHDERLAGEILERVSAPAMPVR